MMRITASVRSADPDRSIDPGSVSLFAIQSRSDLPPGEAWFRKHGFRWRTGIDSLSAHGSFAVTFPRLVGLQLQASHPGFQPVTVAIDVPPLCADPPRVDLVLERSPIRISGSLTSSTGRPLSGTVVTAYVTVRTTAKDLEFTKRALQGHAYTSRVDSRTGLARVTFLVEGRTDSHGRFHLDSNVQGDVLIVVWPPDSHEKVYSRLGQLPLSGIDEVGLVATHHPGAQKVQFSWNGTPLPDQEVVLSDLSAGQAQPAFSARLDRDGSMSTCWLERGHRYTFNGDGVVAAEFTWDGQEKIDLKK